MEEVKIKAVEPVSEHIIVEPTGAPDSYKFAILVALQAKHIYGGTVAPAEKARRRVKGRIARKSRRANR